MKYLIFFMVILTGLLIISCSESPTYTEAYEYLSLINCDGTNYTKLMETSYYPLSFSNAQEILFGGNDRIFSFDLDTFESTMLYPTDGTEWNSSGFELYEQNQKILYWYGGGDQDIWNVTIETGEIENLTNSPNIRERYAKLSPSEDKFAFIEIDYTNQDSIIWSLKYRDFDSTINETIISKKQGEGQGEFQYVDWISEDRLLYTDNDAGLNSGIYIINSDGSNKQFITEGLYLRFSLNTDRTSAVFERDYEIYLINLSDLTVSQILSGYDPKISPNGQKIAYEDINSDFTIYDTIENTNIKISESIGDLFIEFSSDGEKVVFKERLVEIHHRDKRIL